MWSLIPEMKVSMSRSTARPPCPCSPAPQSASRPRPRSARWVGSSAGLRSGRAREARGVDRGDAGVVARLLAEQVTVRAGDPAGCPDPASRVSASTCGTLNLSRVIVTSSRGGRRSSSARRDRRRGLDLKNFVRSASSPGSNSGVRPSYISAWGGPGGGHVAVLARRDDVERRIGRAVNPAPPAPRSPAPASRQQPDPTASSALLFRLPPLSLRMVAGDDI